MGSDPQRPNVLFVLFDCMRSRMLFDPSRRADVPTIRGLIEGGAAFDTCIATATTTSPSMGTLFTGTLPPVHGIRSDCGHEFRQDCRPIVLGQGDDPGRASGIAHLGGRCLPQ